MEWQQKVSHFFQKAERHYMHLQCDKEFFLLIYIIFFNLHSQFTIVQSGDMPHHRERSNSLYLFPQMISFSLYICCQTFYHFGKCMVSGFK